MATRLARTRVGPERRRRARPGTESLEDLEIRLLLEGVWSTLRLRLPRLRAELDPPPRPPLHAGGGAFDDLVRTGPGPSRYLGLAAVPAQPVRERHGHVPGPELLPGAARGRGARAAHVSGGAHLARRLLDGRRGVLGGDPAAGGGALRPLPPLRHGHERRRPAPRPRSGELPAGLHAREHPQLHRGGRRARASRAGTRRATTAPSWPPSCAATSSFAQHNLATDGSFNEFHLIVCRNVLIYFNRALQERVHRLLYQSLIRFGFLGLGSKETVRFTPARGALRGAPGTALPQGGVSMSRPPEAPVDGGVRSGGGGRARAPAATSASASCSSTTGRTSCWPWKRSWATSARTWCAPTPDARRCARSCSRTSR